MAKTKSWVRGEAIGRGTSPMVSIGHGKGHGVYPDTMLIKSIPAWCSLALTLNEEKAILCRLHDCRQIQHCYGDDYSSDGDGGVELYNVLLERTRHGSLHDVMTENGGGLALCWVRMWTESMLRGIAHVHRHGYVHCDIRPENALVDSAFDVKIANFGQAKRAGEEELLCSGVRGSRQYTAPESLMRGEYVPPADVWSLGCVVAEMLRNAPAWRVLCRFEGSYVAALGRDFLDKCMAMMLEKRWTADILLKHPFLAGRIPSDSGEQLLIEQTEDFFFYADFLVLRFANY